MLTAEESAELRVLQAKAYGVDAELSSEESARLRELERRHHAQGEDEGARSADASPALRPSARSGGATGAPAQRGLRIRTWVAAFALILVFAVGVGFGWMLFSGPDHSSIALSQEQRARSVELVADREYDANSLRGLLERDGVTVWLATTDVGGSLCLIVDDGSDATVACSDADRVALDGLAVTHRIPGDGYTDVAHATLLLTGEGEPAVHLDVRRVDE